MNASARCTIHDGGKYAPVTNVCTKNRPQSAYGGIAQPPRNIKSMVMLEAEKIAEQETGILKNRLTAMTVIKQ